MKARRVAMVIISAALVSLVTLSVGLVTNVASSQQQWPDWLAPVQRNPWTWFGIIAGAAVVLAILGAVLAERANEAVPAGAIKADTADGPETPDTVRVLKA